MNIFYVEVDEFKKKHSKTELSQYADIELKNEKRFFEHTIGRYLVKNIARQLYGLEELKIILSETGKPVFENGELYFSISHSKNIVIVCVDNNPCGIDVQYIKELDLIRFSEYYNEKFKDIDEFYRFWTRKEAVYKLGTSEKDIYSTKFNNEYYITVVSDEPISLPVEIMKYKD